MWYVAVVCCVVYAASLLYRLLDIDAILQRQDTLGDVPLRSAPLPPSLFAAHAPARTGLNNGLCGHPRVEALECPRTNARAEHTPLCIAWPLFRLSRWNLPCRAIVQNATCNRRTFPMNHINQSPAGPGVVPQLHG